MIKHWNKIVTIAWFQVSVSGLGHQAASRYLQLARIILDGIYGIFLKPKLSDCRGCRRYKEDAIPVIAVYAVWHLTP